MKNTFKKIASLLLCVCMVISGMIITASAAPTEIVFEFGDDNNTGAHDDGDAISAPTSYTNGSYTLTLTSASKCYDGGHDLTGKSALKLGTSSAVGSFTFTVPDDVTSVIFMVAKYKTNTSKISINGGATTTLTKNSSDGEYDAITIDTTTTKTLNFTTVSGGVRCMIDSITYVIEDTSGGEGGEGGETPDPTPDTTLSIADAVALGVSKDDGVYTEGKYYVEGIITEINNTTYGNMTIKDANDETKTLYIYGTYSADGSTRYDALTLKHEAGDTVKVYGVIGKYNGTAQMEDGWVTILNDVNPPVEPDPEEPTGNTATITFDDKGKRTEFSTTKQVWVENGITVTNNKSSSTSNVADYANPVRFYKSSQLIVATSKKIAKIEFFADTTGYANDLKSAIGNKATVNDKIVTFIPDAPDTSFEFTLSAGKVFLDSITITYETPVAEMGDTSATVGANLGIQQSITLKTEDAANKTLKMDFTIGDNTTTVDPVITDGNYTFSFNNIPAHFMTEEITATLYVQEGDDKVEQGTNKYTIAEYGKAILESADYTTEVKKFVANMLTYGAAAQKKANHNTGNLATAGLETLISQFGSNEAPTADDKMSLSKTDSDVRFYSANVKFSDVNNLIIKLNAEPGNLKLFVNGVEKTLNGKEYISEDINATDYATKFTFELKDGDTVVQTLNYGINSYAYSMYNKASTSTEMKNLASALYAYGVSASNLK